MGIRVNKVLGYGLTDVREHDDSRVNWDSVLLSYDRASGEDYLRWLYGKRSKVKQSSWYPFSLDFAMLREDPKLRQKNLYDAVVYDPEYGLNNVLVLRPLSCGDWHREDDSIDYMTETFLLDASAESRVETFTAGIHPFNGVYMDARTGERLDQKATTWVRIRSSLEESGEDLGPAERLEALDGVTRDLTTFQSWAEASEHIAPYVPEEVQDIAEFGSLFTGPLVWTQLRPLLYTYWA